MKPQDIALLATPGRPAIAPDGTIVIAVTSPDVEQDRYVGSLRTLTAGTTRPLTFGPRDSAPVVSPDGHTVVFLRAGDKGPAQLHAIDLRGGESRSLAAHPLGAGVPVFSPDGTRLAYLAQVPDAGRYGTDPAVGSEAEPPRRIDRMSYRYDERGFTIDKPQQVFVLELSDGAEPRQLTAEPAISGGPAFLPDGRIAYLRATGPDRRQSEFGPSPSMSPSRLSANCWRNCRARVPRPWLHRTRCTTSAWSSRASTRPGGPPACGRCRSVAEHRAG